MSNSEFPSSAPSSDSFPHLLDGLHGRVFRGRPGTVDQFAGIVREPLSAGDSDYSDARYHIDRAVPALTSGGVHALAVKVDQLPGIAQTLTATNLAELAAGTHLLAVGTVVQVSAWCARGSPDAKVYFFTQPPVLAVVVRIGAASGDGEYDGVVLGGLVATPVASSLVMPMGMDQPAFGAKVLNLEENAQTGNRLAVGSYAVGVVRGMTSDTPPLTIVVIGTGVGNTSGAKEVGSTTNVSEAADTATWSKATDATPANVYLVSRVVYNSAGDKTVYAFIRELSFDARGVMLAVSAETRVTVDGTESCP